MDLKEFLKERGLLRKFNDYVWVGNNSKHPEDVYDLSSAFIWEETKEGYTFWADLYDEYNTLCKEAEEPEVAPGLFPFKDIYLRLIDWYGSTALVACDAEGETLEGGHILRITKDGELRREYFLNKSLGFQLDIGRTTQIKEVD